MTIEGRAGDRQFHLQNGRISRVLRVSEDDTLGHRISEPVAPTRLDEAT